MSISEPIDTESITAAVARELTTVLVLPSMAEKSWGALSAARARAQK